MLIYNNEYQTKENPNWTKNKIELQQLQIDSLRVTVLPPNKVRNHVFARVKFCDADVTKRNTSRNVYD